MGSVTVTTYSCYIQILQRGKGRPAVAAAAYRAGERIFSEHDGRIYDYSSKGGIIHKEILLPDHAPGEYIDRATLWNAVEHMEQGRNAWLAWELQLGLPKGLLREQNIALACEYARQAFVAGGMCADVCIHDKKNGNPHAHIMLPLRSIKADGTWDLCWIAPDAEKRWRAAWADLINRYLERTNRYRGRYQMEREDDFLDESLRTN